MSFDILSKYMLGVLKFKLYNMRQIEEVMLLMKVGKIRKQD